MKLAAFSPHKAYNAVKMEAEKYEDNILVEAAVYSNKGKVNVSLHTWTSFWYCKCNSIICTQNYFSGT